MNQIDINAYGPHNALKLTEAARKAEGARMAAGSTIGQTPKRYRRSMEHNEQVEYFKWVDGKIAAGNDLYRCIAAVPNGTFTTLANAARMKAEGLRSGFPDIIIAVPRVQADGTVFGGLYIEMKAPGEGIVSENQMAWLSVLAHAGNQVAICDNWRDAAEVTETYLANRSTRNLAGELRHASAIVRLHDPSSVSPKD